MIFLTGEQKKAIGVDFVINELDAYTPYGSDLIKNLKPYDRSLQGVLATELENIAKIVTLLKEKNCSLLFGKLDRTLMKFKEIRGSVKKLYGSNEILSEVELFELKSFLITLEDFNNCFSDLKNKTEILEINLISMEDALDLLDPEKNRLPGFYLSESYSDNLLHIRKNKKHIEALINNCTNSDELTSLKKKRLEIAVNEEEEELKVKIMLAEKLRVFRDDFSQNVKSIGKFDFIMSKARLAVKWNGVSPQISENTIIFNQVINPEVDFLLSKKGKKMTPLSISISEGSTILTGANMGGKSVALKTFVLNAYLFQCGFFVFAQKATLPMLDYIHFISDDMQSVYTGLSSFGAEIVRLDEIVTEAKNGKSLIVLDEPARGTNPYEGHKIVSSVAKYLNTFSSFTIISTHYDNIATSDYTCYTVAGLDREKLNDTSITSPEIISMFMDYSLIKASDGKTVPRDALSICRLLKLDDELLKIIENEYTNTLGNC